MTLLFEGCGRGVPVGRFEDEGAQRSFDNGCSFTDNSWFWRSGFTFVTGGVDGLSKGPGDRFTNEDL